MLLHGPSFYSLVETEGECNYIHSPKCCTQIHFFYLDFAIICEKYCIFLNCIYLKAVVTSSFMHELLQNL